MTEPKSSMRILALAGLTAAIASAPAHAQRSITVVDGARKTPVHCEAVITAATVSTAPIACRRLDVPVTAANAAVNPVPAGMALALTDARAFCDRCGARDFAVSLYGQNARAMATASFELAGAAPVADWHGAGPFLVVLGGSALRVGGIIPADAGVETIRLQTTGYLIRADQLGQ